MNNSKNFGATLDIFAKNLNLDVTNEIDESKIEFKDPYDGRIQFSLGRKDHWDQKLVFVRVNNTLFLDDRVAEELSKGELRDFGSNLIYLSNFDSILGDCMHTLYTATTICAMDYLDFQDVCTLDLGSGDGVLSLKAKKTGANRMYAVDMNPDMGHKLNKHIRANSMNPNDFCFINADISTKEWLSRIPREQIDIVLMNVGPNYGDVDLEAISLLAHLPRIRIFVGGGYAMKAYREDGRPFSTNIPYELLNQIGFTNYREVVEIRKNHASQELGRVAFIAERPL